MGENLSIYYADEQLKQLVEIHGTNNKTELVKIVRDLSLKGTSTFKLQIEEAKLNLILAQISKNKEQTRVYSAQADILENTGKFLPKKELQTTANQTQNARNNLVSQDWDAIYSSLITSDFDNQSYICNTCRVTFKILGEIRKHINEYHGLQLNLAINKYTQQKSLHKSNNFSGTDTGYGSPAW